MLLRRVYQREETLEIEAIAKDSGLRLCEVVAYNTLLDVFSGCVSGGVRATLGEETQGLLEEGSQTMLHFRNLDWEMDILRDLLIQVEYVREGEVIARAVTYAGYTGVLTGVREGLSLSLNYRQRVQSRSSSMTHYFHYLAVLLGSRSSTPSLLRSLLLSPGPPPTIDEVIDYFRATKSGTCYLTFCSPDEVLILEKDLDGVSVSVEPATKDKGLDLGSSNIQEGSKTEAQNQEDGGIRRSKQFAVVTNHDLLSEAWSPARWARAWKRRKIGDVGGADKIMGDSMERKRCLVACFDDVEQAGRKVTLENIKRWLRTRPVRNETTHFSCIMDPSALGGGMVWVEACEAV
ncbi:hypothetical protein FA13DRAFT_1787132 [Coprinellus micaceus]|uniref:ceramidase n=1 Tax=Coprinellus micaceus TaxID=71717 RepID=A0A4Y7TRG2_COPMI|nr:hypothetical protein FA13DRAFT_1787132 [Coprinellus micaceus]